MELELRSEELQGAHKPPGRALGGRPLACGQWVDPLWLILSPVFFINSKNILRKFLGQFKNFLEIFYGIYKNYWHENQ